MRKNYINHLLSHIIFIALLTLAGCGGGNETTSQPNEDSTTTENTYPGLLEEDELPPISATEEDPEPEIDSTPNLSEDAPFNNLDLPSNTGFLSSAKSTMCGYTVPSKQLTGRVTLVQDGDSIKIGDANIRLDAIDAPELKQNYGIQSRDNLKSMVNGANVTVYYNKKDKYGRIVGMVFTNDCSFINLKQVITGSAWHYKQYQCELPAGLRSEFAAAQSNAEAAGLGLWKFIATPPWVYRNGVDTTPPSCSSDEPSWYIPISTPSTGGSSSSSSSGSSITPYVPVTGCKTVWVNSYTRKDGTRVRGHYRTTCY